MAADIHAFIHGLGLTQVDLLAFSIGGMVGQELALTFPDDVRKLMLVGTGPRGGEGMQAPRQDVIDALNTPDRQSARAYLFFSQSQNGQAEAKRFLARTAERKADLDPRIVHANHGGPGRGSRRMGASGLLTPTTWRDFASSDIRRWS